MGTMTHFITVSIEVELTVLCPESRLLDYNNDALIVTFYTLKI